MRNDFIAAVKAGDLATMERLLSKEPELVLQRDESGVSPLLLALYHRQQPAAEMIRDRKPSLDLFEAAATGDQQRVRQLIDADSSLLTAYSPDGWTALHLAAFFGHPEVVELLVNRGSGIDMLSTNMANTALQAATAGGRTEVVRLLVGKGADLDYATAQGNYTALHGAASGGHAEIAEILLDAGADREVRAADGRTAREMAAASHPALIELFDRERKSDEDDV